MSSVCLVDARSEKSTDARSKKNSGERKAHEELPLELMPQYDHRPTKYSSGRPTVDGDAGDKVGSALPSESTEICYELLI